jgi:hypothetical protein
MSPACGSTIGNPPHPLSTPPFGGNGKKNEKKISHESVVKSAQISVLKASDDSSLLLTSSHHIKIENKSLSIGLSSIVGRAVLHSRRRVAPLQSRCRILTWHDLTNNFGLMVSPREKCVPMQVQ